MEGEIIPLDDTLVRRRPSYTIDDFLSSGNAPEDEKRGNGDADTTEDHDSKTITNTEGIFIDLNKTPMLNKFPNPFQSSPGKSESPEKNNSPLSTTDRFKRLQTMNSKMVIPNINENGLNVDLVLASKDHLEQLRQNQQQNQQHDIANVSMESEPSLNLNVVMIDNTRSPHGIQITETQQDNPIDLDLLLKRRKRPQSVIGDELDFNNYSIHDDSKLRRSDNLVLASSEEEEEEEEEQQQEEQEEGEINGKPVNHGGELNAAAIITIQNTTKDFSSQRVIFNSQSQLLVSPSQPSLAVFSNISNKSGLQLEDREDVGMDDTFTIPKDNEGITSTQNEVTNTKRKYDDDVEEEGEEEEEEEDDDEDEVIKIKRRNTCNILEDESMNRESSPIRKRVLKSKNEEDTIIEETYKIPETDDSNSGYATQIIPGTQSNNIVDSSPQHKDVDQTDFEVPNTSAVSMGLPLDITDSNELLSKEQEKPGNEKIEGEIIRNTMDLKFGILNVLEDSTVFVNLENTEAMRISNVFKREDGYYLDVVSHEEAIPLTVHSKKLFAPVLLNIGDPVKYFKDKKGSYIITGLQRQKGAFLTTSNGFSIIYIKKKSSSEEVRVDLSEIYLTMTCKTRYKFKLFRNLIDFGKYMDSQFVRFDTSKVIKPITNINGSSELYPFSKCVFVITGMNSSPTRPGSKSNNSTANNTPSNRVHIVDKLDVDYTMLIEFIQSKGGKVLQDEKGFETIIELTKGQNIRGVSNSKRFTCDNLKLAKEWKGFEFGCVLSTRHSRTMKYLQGVSLQWPAIHVDFIKDCMSGINGEEMLDNWREKILDYTLPSGDMDNGYVSGMNLSTWMKIWSIGGGIEDMVKINKLFNGIKVLIFDGPQGGNIEVQQLAWLFLSLGSDEVVIVPTYVISEDIERITENGKWVFYGGKSDINIIKIDWKLLVKCIISHRLYCLFY